MDDYESNDVEGAAFLAAGQELPEWADRPSSYELWLDRQEMEARARARRAREWGTTL